MEFVPATKTDENNKTVSKNMTMALCQKIVNSLLFFQLLSVKLKKPTQGRVKKI